MKNVVTVAVWLGSWASVTALPLLPHHQAHNCTSRTADCFSSFSPKAKTISAAWKRHLLILCNPFPYGLVVAGLVLRKTNKNTDLGFAHLMLSKLPSSPTAALVALHQSWWGPDPGPFGEHPPAGGTALQGGEDSQSKQEMQIGGRSAG